MKNRDYFTRPRQAGGRTAHGYGHTKLGYPEPGSEVPSWGWAVFGGFLAIVMIFGSAL